jgi:intein/homing endonuclease
LLSNKKIIDSYKLYKTIINDIWEDKDLKIDPYFLGVLLGDGSGFGSGKTPEISKPDSEIRELVFTEAAKWNLEVREYGEPSNPTYRLVRPGVGHGRTGTPRSSHSLKRELYALGYRDMSCENRFVNNKYKFSSPNTRAEVLAGLLDTDGYYQRGGFGFTSKSNILASDVQFLARSIGLAAYKRKVIKSCQNNFSGEYWAVSISGDCSIIKNRIKRKIAEKRISTKNVLRTGIKSIERLDNVSHSIIEVDGDGLIMLDDFTVIKYVAK